MKDKLRAVDKIILSVELALVAWAMSGCAQPVVPTPAEVFAGSTATPIAAPTPDFCADFPRATVDKVVGKGERALSRPFARGYGREKLAKCSKTLVVFDGGRTNNFQTDELVKPGANVPFVNEGGFVCYGRDVTSVIDLCSSIR